MGLLAFLSRKTNDIHRSRGKLKPAANAAFLGVLALLQMIESACCYCDTDMTVQVGGALSKFMKWTTRFTFLNSFQCSTL